jgi:hypothetical protein
MRLSHLGMLAHVFLDGEYGCCNAVAHNQLSHRILVRVTPVTLSPTKQEHEILDVKLALAYIAERQCVCAHNLVWEGGHTTSHIHAC